MAPTIEDIEGLVGQLDVRDQARLLQYLAPRIASALLAAPTRVLPSGDADEAWRSFRTVGQRVARASDATTVSLTDAVSAMRR